MPIPFLIPGSLGLLGELQLFENPANGSNYVGFRAPAALSASKIWTLPLADGSEDHVLKTDGAGQLAFGPVDWTELANVPSTFTPSSHTHAASDLSSGTVSLTRGGTGNDLNSVVARSMCAINGSNQIAGIGPNTSATRKYFGMTGTGSAGAIPTWTQIGWTELTGVPGSFTPSSHTHAAGDVVSGTLEIARGGTNNTTFSTNLAVAYNGSSLAGVAGVVIPSGAVECYDTGVNSILDISADSDGVCRVAGNKGTLTLSTLLSGCAMNLDPESGTGVVNLNCGNMVIKFSSNKIFEALYSSGSKIAFFAVTPVARQTATDLASVISLLQAYGLST